MIIWSTEENMNAKTEALRLNLADLILLVPVAIAMLVEVFGR